MKKQSHKRSNQARRTQEKQLAAALDWNYVAHSAFSSRRFAAAEKAARRVLRILPGDPAATVLLAELLFRSARQREVAGLARDALRRHPNDPKLHFVLADAALASGGLAEARRSVLRFLELMDANPGAFGPDRGGSLQRARQMLREIDRLLARSGGAGAPLASAGRDLDASDGTRPATVRGLRGATTVARSGTPAATAAAGSGSNPRSRREPAAVALQPSLFEDAPRADTTAAARVDRDRPAAASEAPRQAPGTPPAASLVAPAPVLAFRVEDDDAAVRQWFARAFQEPCSDDLDARELRLESQRILLLSLYEDLLCLPTLQGVERHEFQVETARKILRRLSGRALLCDEVGLGKTIEAGMVIKEYLLRGLVQSVLVLVPPGLVHQWQDEMSQKFGLEFGEWTGGAASQSPRETPLVIGSIAFARHERNFDACTEREWDMVVVDEAHHLRRRTTRSWALVNALRKRFVLLLSATPVHNDLMELYELVTLVKPGLLGTPAEFRRQFVGGKQDGGSRHPERLRELLGEVMVRNTRSHADVVLPRRYATTLLLQPHASEALAYSAASECARVAYPRAGMTGRAWLRHLLGCAGSGPRAVAEAAARRLGRSRPGLLAASGNGPDVLPVSSSEISDEGRLLQDILAAAGSAAASTKADHLLEMLRGSDEQMVVFCRYRATLGELSERLVGEGVWHAVYHGGMSARDKNAAIEKFRGGARVLLSTESGGEGRNIHFCRTIVNYDLPWDPMLIEQRIGRVHRIGQQRDVFVFNLALAGTLEEELLRILENKIHLFELIVGEVDAILGHLERREEFADILLGLWASARDDAERRQRFEEFGAELAAARASYEREKALGDSLLADELEV